MRKIILSFVFFLCAFIVSDAYAADNPAEKLNRGIVNIITAPLEIAKQVDTEWKASSKSKKQVGVGVVKGFTRGLVYTVGRMGSGIWDVVSFPFKAPDNYDPLMKPEYVLDDQQNKVKEK